MSAIRTDDSDQQQEWPRNEHHPERRHHTHQAPPEAQDSGSEPQVGDRI